ncbi:hypothetical protein I7I53_03774 [Histoplasma capsulatum var. duboisii H88]|uniref:Uncharacterized protein n=1 Tax=Ajellomyces capsulatus (strain H88) TaxID=544711 RepID=A0A8A1LT99_AJEC8|nr:hypothetical protein I7I53_03774 [Histoplasma capsulatum var. duboisii H88]
MILRWIPMKAALCSKEMCVISGGRWRSLRLLPLRWKKTMMRWRVRSRVRWRTRRWILTFVSNTFSLFLHSLRVLTTNKKKCLFYCSQSRSVGARACPDSIHPGK